MKLGELRNLAQSMTGMHPADAQQEMHQRMLALGLDPNTFYQELEMTSRFVDTHQDISFSNDHMQLHSHVFYELLYCCSSCGVEYLVGSERYRLQRGDIVFVPPGISHRPLLPEQMTDPYKRYVLWLSQEFMEYYSRLFPHEIAPRQSSVRILRTGGTEWERLGELFRSGVQEAERQEDSWEAAVAGNTITLLTQLKRATEDRTAPAPRAEKPELLDKIMAFVEAHHGSEITIGDLAKRFFVSSSTVSHLFKQKMGVSFYRYVTQRRLIAAKTGIEQGMLLEDAARNAGFGDYSGFYRAFRQEYGISPRQYRMIRESEGNEGTG